MTTRQRILDIADQLIRHKGYNAFSYRDISKSLGLKTASIHYYFPTKSDLVVATINGHIEGLEALKISLANKSPMAKLEGFLSIYTRIKSENKVCLVGSLATDLNTVDENIKHALNILTAKLLNWVTSILEEGRSKGIFHFRPAAKTKALMIITNMLAIVQLSRITSDNDFTLVKTTIIKDLRS